MCAQVYLGIASTSNLLFCGKSQFPYDKTLGKGWRTIEFLFERPVFRQVRKVGRESLPVSAVFQMASAQNNSYTKEESFRMVYFSTFHLQ